MQPAENFRKGSYRESLERWVTTKDAEAARDAALLEFISEQPPGDSPASAWDRHSQLVGARRIMDILFQLPFKEEAKEGFKLPNLKSPK